MIHQFQIELLDMTSDTSGEDTDEQLKKVKKSKKDRSPLPTPRTMSQDQHPPDRATASEEKAKIASPKKSTISDSSVQKDDPVIKKEKVTSTTPTSLRIREQAEIVLLSSSDDAEIEKSKEIKKPMVQEVEEPPETKPKKQVIIGALQKYATGMSYLEPGGSRGQKDYYDTDIVVVIL